MSSSEYENSSFGKYKLAYLPGDLEKEECVGKTVTGKILKNSLVGLLLSEDEFVWFVDLYNKRKKVG